MAARCQAVPFGFSVRYNRPVVHVFTALSAHAKPHRVPVPAFKAKHGFLIYHLVPGVFYPNNPGMFHYQAGDGACSPYQPEPFSRENILGISGGFVCLDVLFVFVFGETYLSDSMYSV